MTAGLWILAGLLAVGIAGWAYGTREERVAGRTGPAILRALAIFLILGGLVLPALTDGAIGPPERVALLDVSRSMTLPVRAGDPAAPTRLDSALTALGALDPDRIYLFGDDPVSVSLDSLSGVVAADERSRLEPAIQAARLGGADSVWLFTDGDVSDREPALAAAAALGLGVTEIRTAEATSRAGLAGLSAPERARAGDTLRVGVEIRAGGATGPTADSVGVRLELDGEVVATGQAARPAPGRTGRVELAFVPTNPDAQAVWRRLEAVLDDGLDPLGASDRLSQWIEVSESAGGAVFISSVPDWEARFLLPALARLVLGGANGFLRLTDGRFMEMGASPRVVDESRVRNAIRGARLLVVQTDPTELTGWLRTELARHPRTLTFAAGPGELPGSDVRVSGPLPGEWYATAPIPVSPSAPLLAEGDLEPLPPLRELYAVEPVGRWSVLNASRNRRGEARPLLAAGERGDRRWAVSAAADWWRWSLRGGPAKRVYEGAFSGIVGWLVEDAMPQLAGLEATPALGTPLAWRIRPGTTALDIRITDPDGAEVWRHQEDAPADRVPGPVLPTGLYEATLTAQGDDGAFELTRPIEVRPAARELLPVAARVPAIVPAVLQPRPRVQAGAPRPVWPFVIAIALLCAEWIWRHRIGLR